MVRTPIRSLQRRFLCIGTTTTSTKKPSEKWSSIKQVTKSNFSEALEEIKSHIAGGSSSEFIAISLRNTGSFTAPWHRVQPFDTAETSYAKAKYSAERFQVFQFAVCPFSIINPSKVVAHPYNFNLFPRGELHSGMPSYSFSCQTSHLTSMAQEGFDFNVCVYDGISYLSRAQESSAKDPAENPVPLNQSINPSTTPSVADKLFIERTKSKIKCWKRACTDNSSNKAEDALISFLGKLVIGGEEYGSRPCINIDVCSDRQVQLVLETLREVSDDLVPLKISAKGGSSQAVRLVLTSSKEDKTLLEKELQDAEEKQNKKIRGFREVIDLISASQKPVITFNFLNDFTFIHSKFLGPLPGNMNDLMNSLQLVFPHVLDVNHLLKDIGPSKKLTNLPTAVSFLEKRFFAPIDMQVTEQDVHEGKTHGNNVLKISYLFAKLCSILKISPDTLQSGNNRLDSILGGYANCSTPFSVDPDEAIDENENIRIWTNNTKKVRCEDLVFLWGFRHGTTARVLKEMLRGSHNIFAEEFDVRLVDKSCAIVVFWQSGLSNIFMETMNAKEITGSLRELVAEGLRVTGYKTYSRACMSGIWEAKLGDALDEALDNPQCLLDSDLESKSSEINWDSDSIINFEEL